MRKLFKTSSEECEYHFVTITEVRLKSGSVVKTTNFISQKNIMDLTQMMPVIRFFREKESHRSEK